MVTNIEHLNINQNWLKLASDKNNANHAKPEVFGDVDRLYQIFHQLFKIFK